MKSHRLPWLLLALATTAALAAFGDPPAETVTATLPTQPRDHVVAHVVAIRALLPRALAAAVPGDPFGVALSPRQAELPAAVVPATVPPAPTFNASLPWRVIGKQQEEGADWSVFLARGEETTVVRVGDLLDEGYRVTAIEPPTLTLQHIQKKIRRTLDIGDARE